MDFLLPSGTARRLDIVVRFFVVSKPTKQHDPNRALLRRVRTNTKVQWTSVTEWRIVLS